MFQEAPWKRESSNKTAQLRGFIPDCPLAISRELGAS
jgi:hypothetical protein